LIFCFFWVEDTEVDFLVVFFGAALTAAVEVVGVTAALLGSAALGVDGATLGVEEATEGVPTVVGAPVATVFLSDRSVENLPPRSNRFFSCTAFFFFATGAVYAVKTGFVSFALAAESTNPGLISI